MNDTDVFHASHRPSRGRRLIAAWRGMAQLGMLLDGRAHTWAGETAAREPAARPQPARRPVAGAPRLARFIA
jgi:hypothetical protein